MWEYACMYKKIHIFYSTFHDINHEWCCGRTVNVKKSRRFVHSHIKLSAVKRLLKFYARMRECVNYVSWLSRRNNLIVSIFHAARHTQQLVTICYQTVMVSIKTFCICVLLLWVQHIYISNKSLVVIAV